MFVRWVCNVCEASSLWPMERCECGSEDVEEIWGDVRGPPRPEEN